MHPSPFRTPVRQHQATPTLGTRRLARLRPCGEVGSWPCRTRHAAGRRVGAVELEMPEIQRSALGDRFGPSRIFTAAELVAEELQPVRWVVRGLLSEGVTLLAGKPKLGKSWLALGLGVAVASGGVALGTKRVEQGSCLYLALEDNRRRLKLRLGKLLAGKAAPKELHIGTEWLRLDDGGVEQLRAWLTAYPGARLIVIDTL